MLVPPALLGRRRRQESYMAISVLREGPINHWPRATVRLKELMQADAGYADLNVRGPRYLFDQ